MDIDAHTALFRALPVDGYQPRKEPNGWTYVLTRAGVPQLQDRCVWPTEAVAKIQADSALHLAGQVCSCGEPRPYLVRLLWQWVTPL